MLSIYTEMYIAIRDLIQNFWQFKGGMRFFNSILVHSDRIHIKSYLLVVLIQKVISTNSNWFIIFEMLSSDLTGSRPCDPFEGETVASRACIRWSSRGRGRPHSWLSGIGGCTSDGRHAVRFLVTPLTALYRQRCHLVVVSGLRDRPVHATV